MTELKSFNHSWATIKKLAKDRQQWKTFAVTLHANGNNRLVQRKNKLSKQFVSVVETQCSLQENKHKVKIDFDD